MGTLFAYSLGISVPLIIMYAIYRWVLSHATFHRFNRLVVLSIYVVALVVIPLLHIVDTGILSGGGAILVEPGNVEAVAVPTLLSAEAPAATPLSVMLVVYIVGMMFMTVKLLVALARVAMLVARSERVKHDGCSIVLHHRNGIVPFSWGRWIFISHTDYEECRDFIIAHERAHLTACHWLDLLVAQLVIIINWFNPVAWLMRSSLQDLHEYEADEAVLENSEINKETYQLFLIKKTVGARFAAIANSLNHSSLKKRITMMLSEKSRSKARMRVLALVPAAALALIFVDNPVVASTLSSVSSTEAVVALPDKDSKKSPLNVADKMPQYPGGDAELMKYISAQVNYPAQALKDGVEGRVVVQFVISETGKVSNAKVLRSVEPSLDAEAVRVISSLPDFIPGEQNGEKVAVKYVLPVTFKLGGKTTKATTLPNSSSAAYKVVDKMPQYPGGETELMKYISAHVNYPAQALKDKVEGRVIVRFVVSETGKVSNAKVLRSVEPSLDAEAVRVISSLPDFIPGEQNGKKVAVEYTLPVTFKIYKTTDK